MPPRFKVCCLQDEQEVDLAAAAGAHLLGFVGRGLSGPEVIDDDARIARLVRRVPVGATAVLLTRDADPDVVVARVRATGVGAVQLCDAVPAEVRRALRHHAPGVRILQVVHVTGPQAIDEARALGPEVDVVLLDSGAPGGPAPVYGGTGATHDWTLSRAIVDLARHPVWLAGGLRAANLATAVATVRPVGVDVCSGLRTAGRLDPEKLGAFVAALRALG